MRWKITVEYHGGPFVGWQRQDNGHSVQQALEEAALAFSGETVRMTGAGRTDAGVHARGQVAHFDLARPAGAQTVRDALNAYLRPHPIAVIGAEAVCEKFNARLWACRRHYLYRILNRRAPDAIEAGLVWHVAKPLDAGAMHESAQALVGHHDFSSFRAAACQALSPLKTIERIEVRRMGDNIQIDVSAPSFLHHQVRNIAGSLKLVGEGKWPVDQIDKVLEARDRTLAGPTAPPQGLYFMRVEYPA